MSHNRSVATLRVQSDDVEGGILINAVDYDSSIHVLVEEPSAEAIAAVRSHLATQEAVAKRNERDVLAKGVAKPTPDPLLKPTTMVIEHPDTPGARMVINVKDFDAAIHRAWTEQLEAEIAAGASAASAEVHEISVETTPVAPAVDVADLIADVQKLAQETSEKAEAEEAERRAQVDAPKTPRGKRAS